MLRNIKVTKGIGANLGDLSHMKFTENNSIFCSRFLKRRPMQVFFDEDENRIKRTLVYDLSSKKSSDSEILQSIIDLLMQLRASQSDQNVFVQNNTVVRQQILNQLKNELLNVKNHISKDQVQKLEVISSNLFDEKALNDILKSLLEESKKKLSVEEALGKSRRYRNIGEELSVFSNISRTYNIFTNLQEKFEDLITSTDQEKIFQRYVNKNKLVNLHLNKILPTTIEQKIKEDEKQSGYTALLHKDIQNRNIFSKDENITRIYKEKDILTNKFELIKNRSEFLDIKSKKSIRRINHNIYESIKQKNVNLAESQVSHVLSRDITKSHELVNIKNLKQVDEETEKLSYKIDFLENKIRDSKKITYKDEKKVRSIDESYLGTQFVNKKILNIYRKEFLDSILKRETEKITSRNQILNYTDKKNEKLIENIIEKEKLKKVIDQKIEKVKNRYKIFNLTESSEIRGKSLSYSKDIYDKYTLSKVEKDKKHIYENTNYTTELINKKLEIIDKTQITENLKEELNKKTFNINLLEKKYNKIIKKQKLEDLVSLKRETQSEIIHKKDKTVFFETKDRQKENLIDVEEFLKRETKTNEILQSRKLYTRNIKELDEKNRRIIKNKNVINQLNILNKNESILKYLEKDINTLNINEKSRDIKHIHLLKTFGKNIENEKLNLKEFKINKNIDKTISSRLDIFKDIINPIYNETLDFRGVHRERHINVKNAPFVNQTEIDTIIKTTSSDIINKTINNIRSKKLKTEIYDEKLISNIKHRNLNAIKLPIVSSEKIRKIKNVEKLIYEKKISGFPTRIDDILERTKVNEKHIYKDVKETQKFYFDNLQERLEQRLVLDKKRILDIERETRNIERKAVVYKSPISLKKISEEINKSSDKKIKEEKAERKIYHSEKQYPKVPEIRKEYVKSEAKGLSKSDVLDMIRDYMGDIDADLIYNKVIDRVESKMLSQSRRRGLI